MEKIGIEHVPLKQGTVRLASSSLCGWHRIDDCRLCPRLPTSSLGVPLPLMIAGLLVGNVFGSLFLALAVAMGPKMGMTQMFISRWSFGRKGNYLFAANWISTVGWFTVTYSEPSLSRLSFLQCHLSLVQPSPLSLRYSWRSSE